MVAFVAPSRPNPTDIAEVKDLKVGKAFWAGGRFFSVQNKPLVGDNGRVLRKDGKPVSAPSIVLIAHEEGNRARGVPIGTHASLASLDKIGAFDALDTRELKRLLAEGIHGPRFADHIVIEAPRAFVASVEALEDADVEDGKGRRRRKHAKKGGVDLVDAHLLARGKRGHAHGVHQRA